MNKISSVFFSLMIFSVSTVRFRAYVGSMVLAGCHKFYRPSSHWVREKRTGVASACPASYFLPKLDFRFGISWLAVLLCDCGHVPLQWGLRGVEGCSARRSKLPLPIWKAVSLPFVWVQLPETKEVFPAVLERLVGF